MYRWILPNCFALMDMFNLKNKLLQINRDKLSLGDHVIVVTPHSYAKL